MKTKEEFSKKAAEMVNLATKLNEEYERLGEAWRRAHYNDDAIYKAYCEAEHKAKSAQRDAEHYTKLASGKKLYANQVFYTDWEPWEVIEIKTDRMIIVRKMKAELKEEAEKKLYDSFVPGGFFGHFNNGCQEWNYISDPKGKIAILRRHKSGEFRMPKDSTRFYLDYEPYKYYDYNF